MKLENMTQLKQFVEEADVVLVGLGQEWMATYEDILLDLKGSAPVIAQILEFIARKDEYCDLIQTIEGFYYKNFCPKKLENAYKTLFELVNKKNYFVLSLSTDSYLKRYGFKPDRIVNPCGTFEKLQCDKDCEKELFDAEEKYKDVYSLMNQLATTNDRISQEEMITIIKELNDCICNIKCNNCKEKIVFNTLDALKYNESGYLDQWQIYMKWLQGIVNKKLCIIEAGSGMELPSVIRWPFEKTAFYNQKAKMIRIHHKFYQVNEDISERAYGMEQNSVDFFVHG